MRQVFSRLVVAAGLFALACATAVDPQLGADLNEGGSGGAANVAGAINNTSGSGDAGTVSMPFGNGGSGGSVTNAFGGTFGTAGTGGSASGGQGTSGSATAGSSAGGKGGATSGGTGGGGKGGTGGTTTGGSGTSGSASGGGGSGSGGTPSSTCNGVANWTAKTYVVGDVVADTCSGPFAGTCTAGQKHKFECNPAAGTPALPWCQSREPGVGNGWAEAWVDKGQCN